jgi:methionyl-tRNA formyltransferase
MRIAMIGQAAFGAKVLEAVLGLGEEVVGVFTPPDPPGKPSPIHSIAESSAVPVFQPKKMRQPEVYETFLQLQPDLIVMAFVTDIVPQRILDLPPLGAIQYHPSLLPKHRGGSAINWAIINGDSKTGLTIFWPDKGIDTGPILLQREANIDPDDTTGSLYFNCLFPMGVEAMVEAVRLVREGKAPRIVQDESLATYEPLCTEERTVIDWVKPVDTLYNLVRGANPQPGAVTWLGGKKVKFFEARKSNQPAAGIPGEVTAMAPEGIWVAAQAGALFVQRLQMEGGAKLKAAEFVAQNNLKPGDRFGS